MRNQGSSASYWFEKDATENQAADNGTVEPVKRRIPSPLNLFARRLRQRDEAPPAVPADTDENPVQPMAEVVERLAKERAAAEAQARAEAEAAAEAMPEAEITSAVEAFTEPSDVVAEFSDEPPPVDASLSDFAPVETPEFEPVAIEQASPAITVPDDPVRDLAEDRPAAQPMSSERVVLEPTPAQPAPVAAEGEVPTRRSSRVKTTFLGFERSDGRIEDVFQKEEKAAAAPATVMFPVGWLVIVDGAGRGNAIALQAGVSQIGRGEDQAVQLNYGDMAISRQNHAAVAYDHEDRRFYLGHGGKANIVRLNGKPVLSTEALEHGDKIKIGETTMQFVALCGPDFQWT